MHENLTKQKRGKNIYPGKAKLLYCKAIKKKNRDFFSEYKYITSLDKYVCLLKFAHSF